MTRFYIEIVSDSKKPGANDCYIRVVSGRGPKTVKIFTNQPNTLDFDQAEQQRPVQELVLTPIDLTEDNVVGLNYVKYQNVQNLTVSELLSSVCCVLCVCMLFVCVWCVCVCESVYVVCVCVCLSVCVCVSVYVVCVCVVFV